MTDPISRAEAKKQRKLAAQRARRAAAKREVQVAKSPLNYARERNVSPQASARRAETSRLRIQTSKIIERVQKHAMGLVDMTPTQLAAATALLRKTLPDLVGVKTELDTSPVVFNFSIGKPKE